MNKFTQIISSTRNETLKRRALQIGTSAQIAQENLINKLKQDLVSQELKVQSLIDMGPDSTDSLRPGCKDWNPERWAAELQKAKETHYELKISLKLAKKTYQDLFTPIEGSELAVSDSATEILNSNIEEEEDEED